MKKVITIAILFFLTIAIKSVQAQNELLTASEVGDFSTIKKCIERGDDVNFFLYHPHSSADDHHSCNHSENRTALFWAVLRNDYEIAEYLLLNGADANLHIIHGTTVLHWAATKGNIQMIKLLLNYKANVNEKDDKGRTPLMFACFYNFSTDAADLLMLSGASSKEKDALGNDFEFYIQNSLKKNNQ